jgi:ribosomal protection tetracycline resistance protein
VSRKTLNLGILAHVDAGKTTLTERLLFTVGVIDRLGSVDAGTTQTDSLALERQRGITIKSAVASFPVGDVTVNLIDTPGHPDFIAEVERVLSVLDGAVLVVSAVEGVQPQTQILMRSLRRLAIPTLLFMNKIDRSGARPAQVQQEIARRLKLTTIAMGAALEPGTAHASFRAWNASDAAFVAGLTETLAENDDRLLAAYLDEGTRLRYSQLRAELAAQTIRGQVNPVFAGSAITGAGIEPLLAGVTELLPAVAGDIGGPASGRIFKIERGKSSEKIAYIRLFAGAVRIRDRLSFGADQEDKVTSIAVFERGSAVSQPEVLAGQIAKLGGLTGARIGDRFGPAIISQEDVSQFPPPTLESVVVPADPGDKERLRVALGQLAEQDPLINVRQDDERQEIYVSLYGEVQKEVIQATLAADFGVAVSFRETTMIYIERPSGRARVLEVLQSDDHPYSATIGLRIEPGPADSGIEFRLAVDPRRIPLYIYKTADSFIEAMTGYIRHTCEQGRYGWQVTDLIVTMDACGYYIGDGPAKQVLPTPRTTAADFRKLTAQVLRTALAQAGTTVCEPISRLTIELPAAKMGAVLGSLAQLGANVVAPVRAGELAELAATLPSARVHTLQERLPGLTGGEGALDVSFGGYQPTTGRYRSRGTTGDTGA